MKKQNTGTLSDKIADILNSAPSNLDPEDDPVDATNAQLVPEDIQETIEEEEILSKFRRANVDLLADVDEKYAGTKATRKSLRDSDEEETEESDALSSSVEQSDEDEDNSSENEDSDDGPEESEHDSDDTNFKTINDTNITNQIKKGVCVRNQMAMWESLLEVRIQLQKCLIIANKMPQEAKFNEIKQESGAEFSNKVTETKTNVCGTLDKLLLLQKLLLKQFPETKNLDKVDNEVLDGDEEIPSDTEPEESEEELEINNPKKRKLEEYENDVEEHHKKYKTYQNNTIQKWNDKTRVILKGGATSHSVLDQIEFSLSNRQKLIARTQLKRSQYDILGEPPSEDGAKVAEDYNTEIFDDDDFYHQLLRELIEVKSADVTDPVQLGRQWIQLQSLRSKMKRKIDTRATKGRKIRYGVHNKLVNFMAPIDENLWTDEAKTELYNSLFGKNQPVFSA